VWSEDENEAEEPQIEVTEDKSVSSKFGHAKQDELRDERDSDEDKTVGASAPQNKPKRGRLKKIINNPYRRKGKPANNEALDPVLSQEERRECDSECSDIEANYAEMIEPQSLEEALHLPQATKWKRAIEEELNSQEDRQTWKVTKLPEGRKCIGCRWIFKIKTDSDGKIQQYKARLIAQGFSQQRGIDYNETYSPVANFSLIRLLLALTVQRHWYTRHIDIKCAYLYGTLQKEIFMRLPPVVQG